LPQKKNIQTIFFRMESKDLQEKFSKVDWEQFVSEYSQQITLA